jgi:hypothetical protein
MSGRRTAAAAAALRVSVDSFMLKYGISLPVFYRGTLKSQILSQNYCLLPNLQWYNCEMFASYGFLYFSVEDNWLAYSNKLDTREYVQRSSIHLAIKHVT